MFYRDHSDIIHGINTINDMIDTNDFKYISALEVVSKIIHDYAFEKEEMQRMSEMPKGLFCSTYIKQQNHKSEIINWSERQFVSL